MAYSFKQRADKGFDFFNDNQKINVDDYVKATGVNKASLTTMMAQRGDTTSQQAMKQSRLPSQFNASLQPGFKPSTSINSNIPQPSFVSTQQSLPKSNVAQTRNPLDFFKEGADLAVKTGQGIINAGVNTVGLLDPTINSQQRNERFQQSIPGAIYRPLEIAGNALGAGIASNVLQSQGYDPITIANAMNEQTSGVGLNVYDDPTVNARKIAGAYAETGLNLATMGNPATGTLKSQTGKLIPASAVYDSIKATAMANGKPVLAQMLNSSKGQAATGALSGAASTMQQDNATVEDYLKNAAMGYAGGRAVGAITPVVNKLLGDAGTAIQNRTYSGRQANLAKQLDALPVGSPERQAVITQMAENAKTRRSSESGILNYGEAINNIKQKITGKPIESESVKSPKYNSINDNEAYTLSDYADMINPNSTYLKDTTNPINITDRNNLIKQARNAAETAGIDIINGSRYDVQNRIADFLEKRDSQANVPLTRVSEAGFIKLPLSKKMQDFASRNIDKTPQVTKTPNINQAIDEGIINGKQSKFTKTVGGSLEVSEPLKASVKKAEPFYQTISNQDQITASEAFIKKQGLNKSVIDVKERLKSKDIDSQTVSDAIATAKALDAKGNPKNLLTATEIFEELATKLSKAGQTVQAASLLSNRTPAGLKYQAINVLKKAGVERTPEILAKIESLKDNIKLQKAGSYEDGLARYKLMEYVSKQVPSSNTSKAMQLWKAGLLTSPRTTAGNIAANTAETILRKGYIDPLANVLDAAISFFYTGKRSRSYTLKGMASGTAEGVGKGIKYFKTGYDPRNPLTKFDVRDIHYSDKPLGKAAEKYTQTVFRLMGSQDQPFYYAALRNSLYDQALTEAGNIKLSGQAKKDFVKKFITEPQTKAMQLADAEARYAVFQDETALGKAALRLKNTEGLTGDIAEFVIPFSGVPSSVATRMIMRTPIGWANTIVKAIKDKKSGKAFDQRGFTQAIANGSMAIPLIGAGYALANAGAMTLGYPTDKTERDLWEAEGKQPYSIKVGDQWLSTNYFQPAGNLMAAGAEYSGAIKDGKTPTEAITQSLAGAGKAFTEQSFLKGVAGAIGSISDPTRYASKFAEQTAGSLVPNIVRTGARAFDPYQREQDNMVDSIKAGIPGVRQSLDTKTNILGEPVTRNSSTINEIINPFKPVDIKNADNKTIQELRRLQDAKQGVTPSQATKSTIDVDDKKLREINQRVSSEVSTEYNKVMNDPRYSKLNDEDKKRILEKVNDTVFGAVKSDYKEANLNKLQQLYKKGADFDYFSNFDMSSTTGDTIGTKLNTKSPSYGFILESSAVNSTDRSKWLREPVKDEYKVLVDNVNNSLPEGLPELPATNKIAELYANFEKDKTDNNWSDIQTKKETKKLFTNAYKSQLSDNEQFISTLTDTEILNAARNGEVTRDEIENIIKVDNILNKLGMTAMIGNKTRSALGYGTLPSSTGSSSSFNMPKTDSALNTSIGTYNSILNLLSGTSKRASTPAKVALKEYKIKGA